MDPMGESGVCNLSHKEGDGAAALGISLGGTGRVGLGRVYGQDNSENGGASCERGGH